MDTGIEIRHACHPQDAKNYDTSRLRAEFLIENLFLPDQVSLTYSNYDRFIAGGAMPCTGRLLLSTPDTLKAEFFLQRRELGIVNVGGKGFVFADGVEYSLNYKEALYLGKGTKIIEFASEDSQKPALFYLNSAPAHTSHPSRKISLQAAEVVELGNIETSNERRINKLIVNSIVPTCQLQMGLTELRQGSVWNTMPAHTHFRRMEVYFYFNVPDGQSVCHFMGEPNETRHLWVKNLQAVVSPNWSIHSAAGTSNYSFIWGMAGENLDYGDMDTCTPDTLS